MWRALTNLSRWVEPPTPSAADIRFIRSGIVVKNEAQSIYRDLLWFRWCQLVEPSSRLQRLIACLIQRLIVL